MLGIASFKIVLMDAFEVITGIIPTDILVEKRKPLENIDRRLPEVRA